MGNIAADKQGLSFIAARLFSFVGPFLPLGTHFAAGNFIRDALNCDQISIQSGGGSIRSYLYATDLCSTLWSLLVVGKSGNAYNVGSDEEITIVSLANLVARVVNQSVNVAVLGKDNSNTLTRYVPSLNKVNDETKRYQTVFIDEAIKRTTNWLHESVQ
jgi:dTDP-glucose 4,6-dehydratase